MDTIKTVVEQAIRNIKAEKEQELRNITQRVTQEKIVPFNREADIRRDDAIKQETDSLNAQIATLQAEFAKKKDEIVLANETYKKNHAEQVIATETAVLNEKYDKAIAELEESLKRIGE